MPNAYHKRKSNAGFRKIPSPGLKRQKGQPAAFDSSTTVPGAAFLPSQEPDYVDCPEPYVEQEDLRKVWKEYLGPSVEMLVLQTVNRPKTNCSYDTIMMIRHLCTYFNKQENQVGHFMEAKIGCWRMSKHGKKLGGFDFDLKMDNDVEQWIHCMRSMMLTINYRLRSRPTERESLVYTITCAENYVATSITRLEILCLAEHIIQMVVASAIKVDLGDKLFKEQCSAFSNDVMIYKGKCKRSAVSFIRLMCTCLDNIGGLSHVHDERVTACWETRETHGPRWFGNLVNIYTERVANTGSEYARMATNLSFFQGQRYPKSTTFSRKAIRTRVLKDTPKDPRMTDRESYIDARVLKLWWNFLCSRSYLLYIQEGDSKVTPPAIRKEVKVQPETGERLASVAAKLKPSPMKPSKLENDRSTEKKGRQSDSENQDSDEEGDDGSKASLISKPERMTEAQSETRDVSYVSDIVFADTTINLFSVGKANDVDEEKASPEDAQEEEKKNESLEDNIVEDEKGEENENEKEEDDIVGEDDAAGDKKGGGGDAVEEASNSELNGGSMVETVVESTINVTVRQRKKIAPIPGTRLGLRSGISRLVAKLASPLRSLSPEKKTDRKLDLSSEEKVLKPNSISEKESGNETKTDERSVRKLGLSSGETLLVEKSVDKMDSPKPEDDDPVVVEKPEDDDSVVVEKVEPPEQDDDDSVVVTKVEPPKPKDIESSDDEATQIIVKKEMAAHHHEQEYDDSDPCYWGSIREFEDENNPYRICDLTDIENYVFDYVFRTPDCVFLIENHFFQVWSIRRENQNRKGHGFRIRSNSNEFPRDLEGTLPETMYRKNVKQFRTWDESIIGARHTKDGQMTIYPCITQIFILHDGAKHIHLKHQPILESMLALEAIPLLSPNSTGSVLYRCLPLLQVFHEPGLTRELSKVALFMWGCQKQMRTAVAKQHKEWEEGEDKATLYQILGIGSYEWGGTEMGFRTGFVELYEVKGEVELDLSMVTSDQEEFEYTVKMGLPIARKDDGYVYQLVFSFSVGQ